MLINKVLTQEEMSIAYGEFFRASRKVCFDTTDVPKNLQPLISYAEFWGISDDWARQDLIQKASSDVKQNLKSVIGMFEDELDAWLACPEVAGAAPSDAYIAFSAMRMGADFI